MTKRQPSNAERFRPKEYEYQCLNIEGEPVILYQLPNMLDLIMKYGDSSRVPEPMVQLVMGEIEQADLETLQASRKDLPTYGEWMKVLVCAAAISPKVLQEGEVPDYKKNEISILDLGYDMMGFYNQLMAESNKAGTFRKEQIEALAALPDGKDVGNEAEPVSGD